MVRNTDRGIGATPPENSLPFTPREAKERLVGATSMTSSSLQVYQTAAPCNGAIATGRRRPTRRILTTAKSLLFTAREAKERLVGATSMTSSSLQVYQTAAPCNRAIATGRRRPTRRILTTAKSLLFTAREAKERLVGSVVFNTIGGAKVPRRVRFPSASATRRALPPPLGVRLADPKRGPGGFDSRPPPPHA